MRCTIMLTLMLFTCVAPVFADEPAPAAHTLILIRHGHYADDPNANPKLGPGLTDFGVAQAHAVAARLAAWPAPIDGRYVSPLQRARDTAATIAGDDPGAAFEVVPDLAECIPPTRVAAVAAQVPVDEQTACREQLDRAYARFVRPAEGRPRTDLLVCHGNVTRYFVTRALGVDADAWLGFSIGHASVTRLRVEADGTVRVLSVGDVGHLPPGLQSGAAGDREPLP